MKQMLLIAALISGCAGPAPASTDAAPVDAAPSDAAPSDAALGDAADESRSDVFFADTAPDAPACSGHGTLHHDHCHCDPGYRAQGLACVAVDRCPEDDPNEPNDSAAQATRLDAGSPTVGRRCAADTDMFVVRASMGQRLVVDLAFRQADGDLDLLLYEPGRDPRVDRAIARSESADDDEQVAHRARVDGDFLVVVTGAESAAQAPYTITATLQP
jgi:hypothetical protein